MSIKIKFRNFLRLINKNHRATNYKSKNMQIMVQFSQLLRAFSSLL